MTDEEFEKLEKAYHEEVKRRESKMRLNILLKDLEFEREKGRGYSGVCCHLTSEEQDNLYVFLKTMFEDELKELNKDEKL